MQGYNEHYHSVRGTCDLGICIRTYLLNPRRTKRQTYTGLLSYKDKATDIQRVAVIQRQSDRHTESCCHTKTKRQTYRELLSYKDKATDIQRVAVIQRQSDRHTESCCHTKTKRQTYRLLLSYKDRATYIHTVAVQSTDMQVDWNTDRRRQTNIKRDA